MENTITFQLGYFVGEFIVAHYLPALSTDVLHSRKIIEVSEEDSIKLTELKTMYDADKDAQEKSLCWDEYRKFQEFLAEKYIPTNLECPLYFLLELDDELEFKKGLGLSLWDCDICYYKIMPEDIKIVTGYSSTIILSR